MKYLLILILNINIFASSLQIDMIHTKENSIYTAINTIIENQTFIPNSISELINKNLIPTNFDTSNGFNSTPISFSINAGTGIVTINTHVNINNVSIADKEYYLNGKTSSSLVADYSIVNNELIAKFMLTPQAILNIQTKNKKTYATYIGSQDPVEYATVKSDDIWLSSTFKNYDLLTYKNNIWIEPASTNNQLNPNGTSENNIPVGLSSLTWDLKNVNISEVQKNILCKDIGTNYNPNKNRCEAYTSDACSGKYYDKNRNKCRTGKIVYTSKSSCWKIQTRSKSCGCSGCSYSAWRNVSSIRIGNAHYRISSCRLQRRDYHPGTCSRSAYWSGWYNTSSFPNSDVRRAIKGGGTCPSGYTNNGSNCKKSTISYSNPSCAGKKMPVAPYYSTPYYGNNGLCYSDAGLYCKKTGLSWDGKYICFNKNFKCTDQTYTVDLNNDRCVKYNYSCNSPMHRYGLASGTNPSSQNLFDRISDKRNKMENILSTILSQDYTIDDNKGSMCVDRKESTFNQSSSTNLFNIGGNQISGF
jgi:hypothetical protein